MEEPNRREHTLWAEDAAPVMCGQGARGIPSKRAPKISARFREKCGGRRTWCRDSRRWSPMCEGTLLPECGDPRRAGTRARVRSNGGAGSAGSNYARESASADAPEAGTCERPVLRESVLSTGEPEHARPRRYRRSRSRWRTPGTAADCRSIAPTESDGSEEPARPRLRQEPHSA